VKLCSTFGNFKATLIKCPIYFSVGGTDWRIVFRAGPFAYFAWTLFFHGEGDVVKLCCTFGNFEETLIPICFSVGGSKWTRDFRAGPFAYVFSTIFMSVNGIRLPFSIFVNADAEVPARNTLLCFEESVGTAVAVRHFAPHPFPDVTNFFAARLKHHNRLFRLFFISITDLRIGFPWFLPLGRCYADHCHGKEKYSLHPFTPLLCNRTKETIYKKK